MNERVARSPFHFLGCWELREMLGRRAYDERELRIGASVGVAVTRAGEDGAAGPEELLTRADHAVYRAKAGGRGRIAF